MRTSKVRHGIIVTICSLNNDAAVPAPELYWKQLLHHISCEVCRGIHFWQSPVSIKRSVFSLVEHFAHIKLNYLKFK